METQLIENKTNDQTINLALDTIRIGKQALVFTNTKKSAEKTAEDIGSKIKDTTNKARLFEISEKALHALTRPTKQCERLAKCIKNGTAFHHAGLTQKQRELIEEEFLKGTIKIISATPTLAAGVDLPAFRTIIKDARRYGQRGLQFIPVLEYLQMAGRAGRPKYDTRGETILIAKTEAEKDKLIDKYIYGEPENIYSKLAVEPALRFYLLSLIAGNFVRTKEQIISFFSKTYWAYQYEDMQELTSIIERMLKLLSDFGFITSTQSGDFVTADELGDCKYTATKTGRRVSELYIDPLTAYELIKAVKRDNARGSSDFALLHMVSFTRELRPLLRVKMREYEHYLELSAKHEDELVVPIPTAFDYEYDEFIDSVKTASFFHEWIDERDEEYLLEKYDIRPGEIRTKIDIADWLFYSASELSKLLELKDVNRKLNVLRTRLKHGAREELLPLLRIKNIGRVRARKLFKNGLKDVGALKKVDLTTLQNLIGQKTAVDVKRQLGEDLKEVPKGKRKGQLSMGKFNK
ncbi:MAG: helicase-related protein [Nanoarchaeota archaeon]